MKTVYPPQTKFTGDIKSWKTCADLESYVRGDPNLITFFFFFKFIRGRKDPNTTISGP